VDQACGGCSLTLLRLSSATRNCSETRRSFLANASDIFYGIDQLDRSIANCIRNAEATLQHSGPQGPGASTSAFDRDLDDFIYKFGDSSSPNLPEKLKYSPVFESKSLSAVDENLDFLLQLGDREATACQGAPVFDDYSDSGDHITPLLGGHQALAMESNLVGELTRRKVTKPSKPLDINPPRYTIDPDELPFQEGRPLDSSDEEGGLI
jgi:hypothetical protein